VHDIRVLREQIDALREAMRRRGTTDQYAPLIERGAALTVERDAAVEEGSVLIERAPPAHRLAERVDLLAKDAGVMHGSPARNAVRL